MIVVVEDVNKDVGCFERVWVFSMIQLGKFTNNFKCNFKLMTQRIYNVFIWWNTIKTVIRIIDLIMSAVVGL